MKHLFISVAVALPLIAAGFWAHQQGHLLPHSETPSETKAPAGEPPRLGVVALGRVEPRDGIIDVSALVGDRLASLGVAAGSTVKANDKLGELDSYAVRTMELAAAEQRLLEAEARRTAEATLADARVAAAQLGLKQAVASKYEIAAQREQLPLLEKNSELASKDLGRIQGLSKDLVSDQQLERQMLLVQKAEAELAAARATLKEAERGYGLSLRAARTELKTAKASRGQVLAAVPVESLRQARDMIKFQLERSQVLAPAAGTVLRTFVQVGEYIGREPILQLANLEQMVVVAEVYEADVKRLSVGQTATITSSAFPDQQKLTGEVLSVSQMISSPAIRGLDPLAPVDRHVVEVRVKVDPQHVATAAKLINLQVDVWFEEKS